MSFHPDSVVNLLSKDLILEIHHLDIGDIIFLNKTIVTELKEGVTYDWHGGLQVISLAEKFYGENFYVNYIANRIHDYAVKAQDWTKFFQENRSLRTFCIVTYGKTGTTNIAIERLFYKEGKIMHFTDLRMALQYTGNLP